MPLKRKSQAHHDKEKESKDAPEADLDEEEVDPLDEEEDESLEETKSSEDAQDEPEAAEKGPKINFDYEFGKEEEISSRKKDQTLEDLANKYRDEPDSDEAGRSEHPNIREEKDLEDESLSSDESEETEIPKMRAQMPTSGIYSAQDIRRGGGEMHQEPSMRNSFSSHSNGNYRPSGNKPSFSSNKSSKIHFVVLALIGLVVLGSAVYLLKYQFKQAKPEPTASPTPVVESTPSPSPTPTSIDRSKFTVRVLNGTGKSGLAASVAAQLKELGYKTDKTGNATTTTQTTIKAKTGSDDLIKQLITDLSSSYSASSASASLKSSDASDAEVTIGNK